MSDEKPPRTTDPSALLQGSMRGLEGIFPGCAITLLIAPFEAPPGARVNYVSNAKRPDMIAMLKEITARLEGRAHDAPERPQ